MNRIVSVFLAAVLLFLPQTPVLRPVATPNDTEQTVYVSFVLPELAVWDLVYLAK